MKKLYTLLTLALLFVGSQSALADGTTTTRVDDETTLSNTHIYYLQGPRGFLTAESSASSLTVTQVKNGTTYTTLNDASVYDTNGDKDASYQFLILTSGLGNYYIYSVNAGKYIQFSTSSISLGEATAAATITIDADGYSAQTYYKTSLKIDAKGIEISRWTATLQTPQNDLGSYWAIMDAGEITDETLSATATTALYNIDKAEAQGCIDMHSDALSSTLSTELSSAISSTETDYQSALHSKLAEAKSALAITAGTYYKIKCCRTDATGDYRYISSATMTAGTDGTISTAGSTTRVTASDAVIPQLWTLAGSDGTYTITNVNSGTPLGGLTASTATSIETSSSSAASFTTQSGLTASTASAYRFRNNSLALQANGGISGSGSVAGSSANDAANNDGGTLWSLIPVTSFPLTIGSTGWASICYPFPVAKPSGLTVYKVSAEETSYVTLEEVTGDVIPANTGFFVSGNAGSYTMTISSSEGSAVESGLEGTTLQRTGFEASAYYALAASNGKAVLKTNAANVDVPANKAYLDNSTNNTRELSLNLGETTGISHIATPTTDSETFYDLQGRRVLYPVHGIFVKSNGQKVYIK